MNILLKNLIILTLVAQSNIFSAGQTQTAKPAIPKVVNGSLPHVSPNGKQIVFSSNRSGTDDLFVIKSDGSEEKQLTNTTEHEGFVAWTSDSNGVLFYVLKNGVSTIFRIDITGQNQQLIARVPGRSPALSSDGKQLLYATGSWTEMSLYLTTLSGENPRQINDGKSIAWKPTWSPNGKEFAFTGRNNPKSELAVFVTNADGTQVRQVSNVPLEEGAAQWPVWSNDGRWLAIQVGSRVKKNSAHIWLVEVATGQSRKLAAHEEAYLDETPSWFPDGKRLAFQSDRTGRMEVWIMNVDGTNPRQLTR
jgi:Tol biopolymer transport system component